MSEVGLTGGMKAEFAFVRDLELGALQDVPAETPALAPQRAERDVAASDPTKAFALMYAQFSSGAQVHGKTFAATGDRLTESTHDGDAREPQATNGREPSVPSAPPQTPSTATAGAPGATSDLAAYALTPQTPSIDSPQERRERQRDRHREPEQREETEPQKPGYTIDDIVQFAGVTVAERHTQPMELATRTL